MRTTLILIGLHFLADQLLQLRIVMQRKHTSVHLLIAHVLTWTLFVFPVAIYLGYLENNIHIMFLWPMACMVVHFITEFIFSAIYTPIYEKDGNRHHFIWLVCFEQMIILLFMVASFIEISTW